jgi:hypothetical protein
MKPYQEVGKLRAASTGDCVRLLNHLQDDYIPGLRIEMHPMFDPHGDPIVIVQLVDYAHLGMKDDEHRSIWASRLFRSEIYLISHNQLFDLLIDGHKVIETFFSTGVDNRPSAT